MAKGKIIRGELGTEELIPVADVVMENFVILKTNTDYVEEVVGASKKK
jgi:hypothetical protein